MKNLLRNLIITVGLIAIGLAVLSNYYESKLFTFIVIFLFAITSMFIGLEAILLKEIIFVSRYSRRLNETYRGIAAIAHGVIFIIISIFLGVTSFIFYQDSGDNVFQFFIKRPGVIFLIIGVYLFSFSLIAFVGYKEQTQTSRFVYYLDLITSRLLLGTILLVWALAITALGIIEIIDPVYFDSIGGGFLELLFQNNNQK